MYETTFILYKEENMNEKIIDYINKYEKLIDSDSWDIIYDPQDSRSVYVCFFDYKSERVPEFTTIMLDAGIDPLESLDYVPSWYQHQQDIKYVNIPNHIKRVGYCAYRNCEGLYRVTLPNSVKHIEERAFYGCTNLEGIYLPDSVTNIEAEVFAHCSKLSAVSLPKDICKDCSIPVLPNNLFYGVANVLNITYRGTAEEWRSIFNVWAFDRSPYFGKKVFVECSDKSFKLDLN
jgi:hypothetical protein